MRDYAPSTPQDLATREQVENGELSEESCNLDQAEMHNGMCFFPAAGKYVPVIPDATRIGLFLKNHLKPFDDSLATELSADEKYFKLVDSFCSMIDRPFSDSASKKLHILAVVASFVTGLVFGTFIARRRSLGNAQECTEEDVELLAVSPA